MNKFLIAAALMAAAVFVSQDANAGRYGGSYGGGFRSSSSFRSSSFSSRSFSTPKSYGSVTRSYAGPKSSFYSKPSVVKPTLKSETPRSIIKTAPARTTYYSSYNRHGYHYSPPPSSYHGSNMGWYAFAAYVMFFDHNNNPSTTPATAPNATQQKGLCDLTYDDLAKIVGDDGIYTKQETAVVQQWRTSCNHPRN